MKLVVDVSGLAYRDVWRQLKSGSASPRDCARRMVRSLMSITQLGFRPTQIILAYDGGRDARTKIYPEYKAQRTYDPELRLQVKETIYCLKELVQKNKGMVQYDVLGVEADDIIAWVCQICEERIVLMSKDRDFWQLTKYSNVMMIDYDGEIIEEDLKPAQHLAYKVLVGDVSDNIKGVVGVGDKKARALLSEHGSLKQIVKWSKSGHKLGRMTYEEAILIIRRNLALMRLGRMDIITGKQQRELMAQWNDQKNRRFDEGCIREMLWVRSERHLQKRPKRG